jgi:hypothetical protein
MYAAVVDQAHGEGVQCDHHQNEMVEAGLFHEPDRMPPDLVQGLV